MGKSAKLHKRTPKKVTSATPSPASGSSNNAQSQAKTAKKRAALKNKNLKGKNEGPVLGGVDYVALMMGGRKKAKEEALKMAQLQE